MSSISISAWLRGAPRCGQVSSMQYNSGLSEPGFWTVARVGHGASFSVASLASGVSDSDLLES